MAKQAKNTDLEEQVNIDNFKIIDIELGEIYLLVNDKEIKTTIEIDEYERVFIVNHKNKYIGKLIKVKYFGNIENYEILPIKEWIIKI